MLDLTVWNRESGTSELFVLSMADQKTANHGSNDPTLNPSTVGNATLDRKAEVQHNNGRTLRFFNVEGIPEKFDSRDEAEQYVVGSGKEINR